MTRRSSHVTVLVFSLAVAAAGCGKKDEDKGGKSKGKDKGKTSKNVDKDNDKGKSGSSAGWDEATYKKMSETKVDGFELQPGARATKNMANLYYKGAKANAKEMVPFVAVTLMKCPIRCMDLEVDKAKANQNLKMNLPKIHKDNPKLVWDVFEIDFGGKKGLGIYNRSFMKTADGKGTATANGLMAFYHNGKHIIQFNVSARGAKEHKSAKDEKELEEMMSKDEMVAAAKAVFAGFAGNF